MIKRMKNEQAITMITLVITILLLVIVTGMIAVNATNSLQLGNLTKLQNDVEALNDRVASYYVKNGKLPVDEDTIILRSSLTEIWDISPNDGDTYYTIKLEELTNLTLNYGKEYQISGSDDRYIINRRISYDILL